MLASADVMNTSSLFLSATSANPSDCPCPASRYPMAYSLAAIKEAMPPDPCTSFIPAAHSTVDPVVLPLSLHSALQAVSKYSVVPEVLEDPSLRWATLILVPAGTARWVLAALMSGWSHSVMVPAKILANKQGSRSMALLSRCAAGTEWKIAIAPTAKGMCTIFRSPSLAKLAADMGISPDPKWLNAVFAGTLVSPTNSAWPVLLPTPR
mmetsp:Transcript_3933/g.8766  ORF Transcript_3933/g.8766 Transcript_3933/m.8766 type:complete len:209 (+) Transcript_3933:1156-1782(+)